MVVKRGDVLVPLDRNPLEVFLLAWAAQTGLWRLIALCADETAPPPDALPIWVDITWYLLLLVGGVGALIGAYWRDALTGVLIIRAAMWPLGAGGVMYAAALWVDHSDRQAVVILSFGAACVWRALEIHGSVRAMGGTRRGPR